MKKLKKILRLNISVLLIVFASAINCKAQHLMEVSEVSPWCIIGFDSKNRGVEERIAMLKELGITKYGYNRGNGKYDEMEEEFQLARENDIEITSVFLWLNAKRDSLGKLSPSNEKLLNNLMGSEHKPTIWVSFSDNYFKDISQRKSVALAVKMIQDVKKRTDALGCKLALYNHRGWFGNPMNQLKVLEKLKDKSISMVFNFHHAREYVKDFSEIAPKITPYLSYVNLSGVNAEGPEIVTLGEGTFELQLIKQLLDQGYKGPWGILGHVKTEDVQAVLERNIAGLEMLKNEIPSEE